MATSTWRAGAVFLALFAAGCGSSDSSEPAPTDAGKDTGDAATDAIPDGPIDTGSDAQDAPAEATPDAGPDAPADAEPDAEPDATPDADPDATPDADPDATPDAPAEAEPDADPDATPDAPEDAVPDALPDAVPDAVPDVVTDVATDTSLTEVIDVVVVLGASCAVAFTPTEISQPAGKPMVVRVTNGSATYHADLWTSNGAVKINLAPGASWTTSKTFCNELMALEAHIEAFNHNDLACDPGKLLIHCE